MDERRATFHQLHESGLFVMPNAWDVGSARVLAASGFPAIATTSSGFAASLGRPDGAITLDELVAHVGQLAAAVDIPLSVDAERCFAAEPSGIGDTVTRLADAGAAGLSIEDWDPQRGRIDPVEAAAERVAAAVEACRRHGVVLTARAENLLHGVDDLDDTIARLQAYRAAGADVTYAPGVRDVAVVERVVGEVDGPQNVLAWPGGADIAALRAAGVRRVSMGGALAWVAYGALAEAARELATGGTTSFLPRAMSRADREAAFSLRRPS